MINCKETIFQNQIFWNFIRALVYIIIGIKSNHCWGREEWGFFLNETKLTTQCSHDITPWECERAWRIYGPSNGNGCATHACALSLVCSCGSEWSQLSSSTPAHSAAALFVSRFNICEWSTRSRNRRTPTH